MTRERLGLALGSGGWKGLAHLGVLRALEELEIRPALYASASVGALVAAAGACRIRLDELERLAGECRQRSLFRVDLRSLIRYGVRTPALFSETPLRSLCERLFGRMTFAELPTPAVVATVDVWSGETIWWGTPGLRMVPVADAVYASCAMPGLLPPGRVGSRLCMDGGVLDPLGLHGLYGMVDQIVVVELGNVRGAVGDPMDRPRGASLWWSAQALVMQDLTRRLLHNWDGPPMQVIRPQLRGVEVLKVRDPERVIRAGYDAAWSRLGNDSEAPLSRLKPRLG
jgi:NTE family protein